ncbi:fumarylacetoacetate (FAA) hydrolase family protein [Bordetella holmesii 70147]|nr:fumarylacetoacetate (FAA) hydrolase family protein [Bordetella holmesii 70147]
MVVAIGKGGKDIEVDQALAHVWGYAVGLDLTRRDLQAQAKKMGRPWDWSKAFDASSPITPLRPASEIGHPQKGRIWLDVNGSVRQQGDLAELIWSVPEVIAAISRSVALKPGDLIFTGTPAGVAALQPGDVARGGADGIGEFELTIGPKVAA